MDFVAFQGDQHDYFIITSRLLWFLLNSKLIKVGTLLFHIMSHILLMAFTIAASSLGFISSL